MKYELYTFGISNKLNMLLFLRYKLALCNINMSSKIQTNN